MPFARSPNLVVSGCRPWEEDSWQCIRVGDLIFDIVRVSLSDDFRCPTPFPRKQDIFFGTISRVRPRSMWRLRRVALAGRDCHRVMDGRRMVNADVATAPADCRQPCGRCAVPTVDPKTGKHNQAFQPIRALREYRQLDDLVCVNGCPVACCWCS